VVGGPLRFVSDPTATDAVVLTADDFEQGTIDTPVVGSPISELGSSSYIRSKNPIFLGGSTLSIGAAVEGYRLRAISVDRDGTVTGSTAFKVSGTGVTLTAPAGQYAYIVLSKEPVAATVPADATAAQITFTGTYEYKLSVIDSRVEVNSAYTSGAASMSIIPGGRYTFSLGAKYPEAIIRNSRLSIGTHLSSKSARIMGQIIGSTATLDSTTGDVILAGLYTNVKNLTASGVVTVNLSAGSYNSIQATDCDNFAVSPTIFPGVETAQAAKMPFIFQGCNVPNGLFYHHTQIANTYKNIDFALAQTDLGKATANAGITLVSSEVEGMYRLYANGFGALVESHDSVKSLNIASANLPTSYGTTIYKDAYLNGLFDVAGTNVFGNKVRSHPVAQVLNVQPRAVQGTFNTIVVGETITGVTANANRVCVPIPFRVNGSNGLTINCPMGVEGSIVCTDINGVVKGLTVLATGESSVPAAQLVNTNAYLFFGKAGGGAVTPADLAGVTVTVYNGCKIVNTRETAVNMKGNIRVEDNATLVNASVVGSGYFGGNAVMSGVSINGCAYMKDNTLCTKTSENVQAFASLVMEGNAVYKPVASSSLTALKVFMYDNSKMLGSIRTQVTLVMRDNATITAAGSFSGSSSGFVTIKDNAILGGNLYILGDITLCGSYNQTVNKTWTGKRTITDVNASEYDNNVKTQYDF
jgi:hypothetical protein